ncbi:MAG: 4Fe-4S binding protein [Nitrospirae bacterium]|nr:MAG: 4Fe-4S binding protein [Nitrospirota bacterium]
MTWKGYRRIAETVQAVLIVGLPFLKIKGESALRFDIPTLKLHFFGTVLWINEFYLFLLATVFFLMFIVFITTIFGRIWCGWLCPQTVLLDFSSDLVKRIPFRYRDGARRVVLIPLSALVSLTLIWYFVPPLETWKALFHSKVITGFFLTLWVVIYLELAFLGRRFCKSICPYSMLQSGLFDKDTLVIEFDTSRQEGCMGCDKCAHVCPVGIDIKKGLRRECVACAECIDACVSMTRPRGIAPFIGYTGKVLRPKMFIVGGVTLLLGVVLFVIISLRPPLTMVVSREPVKLVKGVNEYTMTVTNNTGVKRNVTVSLRGGVLIGSRHLEVSPYTRLVLRYKVRKEGGDTPLVFVLKDGKRVLEQEVGFL